MEIRTAERGEIKNVSNLWLIFVQDPEGSDLNIVPNEENRKRWMNFVESLMSSDTGTMKIAIVEKKIVGYILYSWHITPLETRLKVGTIYDLFVLREYRRRGIGTELLKEAINDLKSRGIKMVR